MYGLREGWRDPGFYTAGASFTPKPPIKSRQPSSDATCSAVDKRPSLRFFTNRIRFPVFEVSRLIRKGPNRRIKFDAIVHLTDFLQLIYTYTDFIGETLQRQVDQEHKCHR